LIVKSYVPPQDIREIRTLLRQRETLVRSRTMIKNRVHATLASYSIRSEYSDIFGKQGLEWLNNLDVPSNLRLILDTELSQLNNLNTNIERIDSEIASNASKDPRVERLMGFTGMDFYTAMVLIYEIGDVSRFPNPKKLVAWAGLAPSLHQSGKVNRTGSITKQRNKWVRWILVQAAHRAAHNDDPKLEPFFERIARKKGNQKAIVAVARKLLVSVYFVLSKNELYRGDRADIRERKLKRLHERTDNGLHA